MGNWTDMWAAFDKLFDNEPSFWADGDRRTRHARVKRQTTAGHGCICPPGAEATCKGALCPRRPIGPAS